MAGFGVARAGSDQPITPRTMFSVQSCSKMYTATAAMLAVQEGLVELDRPITSYLPDFTVNSCFEAKPEQKITLRNLLSHTAGFTHEAPLGSNFRVGRLSFAAHCCSINDTWLRFPVGHHYEYSNLGIDLAAYVLQYVSRLPFHEFVRRRLFAPLGLERTSFDQRAIAAAPDRAVGHWRRAKRLPVKVPMIGAGGLYTSVEDACRFVRFFLDDGAGLLSSGLVQEMYRIPFAAPEQEQGYGLGIAIQCWNGVKALGHSGGGFGFLADISWSCAGDIGIVVLTNSVDHPLQGELVKRILFDLVDAIAIK
jgi:CubicO group peptidase (beta-lactamase class C family)